MDILFSFDDEYLEDIRADERNGIIRSDISNDLFEPIPQPVISENLI